MRLSKIMGTTAWGIFILCAIAVVIVILLVLGEVLYLTFTDFYNTTKFILIVIGSALAVGFLAGSLADWLVNLNDD